MTLWRIVTLVIVLVSLGALVVAGSTPTWLSPSVKSVMFALLPPVAVAVVLVAYFDWRVKFTRRIRNDERDGDEPMRAQ